MTFGTRTGKDTIQFVTFSKHIFYVFLQTHLENIIPNDLNKTKCAGKFKALK